MKKEGYKKTKGRSSTRVSYLLISILIILIVSSTVFSIFFYYKVNRINVVIQSDYINDFKIPKFVSLDNITLITMKVPAVDDQGNGITTSLIVEAMPGSGRTLVDIDNLLFWADTQQSIRLARIVAANLTGLNINNYDLIYNIHANATLIGGESAGAAITITTIAALTGKKLNDSVMITGTINHDGSIGPVTEIISKAEAAKKSGASVFLVPLLQSRDVIYETREHCEKFGPTKICSIEQLPKRIDVTNQTGIKTIEIGHITEALNYFIQ